MVRFLAETPKDQEIIDYLVDQNKTLKDENERLRDDNQRLKKEMDEYKNRHPSTIGIKNGKYYEIKPNAQESGDGNSRKQGAQVGYRGHFRRMPSITERITLEASDFQCPVCSSTLLRRGFRERVVEDVPPIRPNATQYSIERMYCRKCRRMYEPEVPNALHGARLSLRTMLISSYLKVGMRMSLESVSTAMEEMFGIRVSEGEVQDILYRLSDALGSEYINLLDAIRKAP